MDLQTGVVSVYVKDGDYIPRVARVLELARHAGMRVVHVKVGFRPRAAPFNDIDTLVLLGIATSGVVLSTFLQAFDADYRLVVIKDCCADTDADLHACLIDKFFPRISSVITAGEFQDALATSA